MTRVRSVIALIGLVVVVALLAGLSLVDPFHLRHARWFTSALIGLVLVLLTAAAAVVARRGLLRGLVIVVGVVAVLAWGGFVFGASRLAGTSLDVTTVAAGGRSLVVVQGSGATVTPVYAVVVRSGGAGPFEQESLVYQGQESSPPPLLARFVDDHTVEVQTLGGCGYRSNVETVTLAVDPVHRPLLASGC